jgi:hypothetical protein
MAGAGGSMAGAGGNGAPDAGPTCTDADNDGQTTCSGDCNDASAVAFQGNVEICGDGIDNDCNGQTDETCAADAGALGTYVSDQEGLDTNPGTPTSPVKTIYQGILNAQALGGNTAVIVAEGTYAENFPMFEGISLRGGFECNGSSCTWARDPSTYTSTIEDQDGDGVLFDDTITRATVLDGFTIVGQDGGNVSPDGRAAVTILGGSPTISNVIVDGPDNNGGSFRTGWSTGILVNDPSNASGGPLITDSTIQGGTANQNVTAVNFHWGGGGVVTGTLARNVIRGGQGTAASAIALWSAGAGILIEENDIVAGNATQDLAWGITGGAEAIIRKNQINVSGTGSCTQSTRFCGGLNSESSKMTITNNVIHGVDAPLSSGVHLAEFEVPAGDVIVNSNTLDGGGTSSSIRSAALVVEIGSCTTCGFVAKVGRIRNNILTGGAGQERYGLWEEAPATRTQHPDFLENNLFFIQSPTASDHLYRYYDGSTATFFDTIAEVNNLKSLATLIGGAANNVEGDPMLDSTNHLGAGSAASDKGTATEAPTDDIDGESRPQGAGYDIGADEAG